LTIEAMRESGCLMTTDLAKSVKKLGYLQAFAVYILRKQPVSNLLQLAGTVFGTESSWWPAHFRLHPKWESHQRSLILLKH
jgi:hypothetical protein